MIMKKVMGYNCDMYDNNDNCHYCHHFCKKGLFIYKRIALHMTSHKSH
jgi:hypothetical protein